MRQIATLPDEATARTFADYLLTLQIETQLEPEDAGVAVWVRDEDKVARARQELEAFHGNPSDPRYRQASAEASQIRLREQSQEDAYRRRQANLERKMAGGGVGSRPVTIALMAGSLLVALLTNLGESTGPVIQALRILSVEGINRLTSWPYLPDVASGQVWRLVTPIFIHYGLLHLVFNMYWLLALGGQIERRRGSVRFLLLVLVAAVLSNLGEYYLGRPPAFVGGHIVPRLTPFFGGMSGVVYALFGYAWVKARFQPELGLEMPREIVLLMLAWFFFCIADSVSELYLIGPVANTAHGVGLLVGMAVATVPLLWRR